MYRRRERLTVSDSRAKSVGCVVVLVVGLVAYGGGLAVTATAAAGSAAEAGAETPSPQFAVQSDDADDNVTRRHRNPSEYDESGDLEALEDRLVARMVEDLEEGSLSLEDGDYERAMGAIDEDYNDSLDRYADVADEIGSDRYDDLFEHAGENQQAVIEAVRRYNDTKAEYERARDAGDEERARSLARELEAIATTVNESGHALRENYDDLETATDADLSESDAAIETVVGEIRSEQATVRETEFVATDLAVELERSEISFSEPLTATGRLRTADGRPVGNEPIRLDVGNGTVETETAADGSFAFEYRPTEEPLSTDRLSVEYVPANDSVYLGSETAVDVSIEQVEPSVSSLETTDEIAYGETAAVRGELRVDGVPVDGAPLAVVLGDERLGTAETTNGTFAADVEVPASVADGERELGVRLEYEDRALAATTATNDVTVRETEVDGTVSASRVGDGRTVAVEGTLETVDGSAVANQSVPLSVDGTTLETVTTDGEGAFTATIEVPDETARGEVQVVATYDGSGSNLASDTAASTVTFATDERSWLGLPARVWLGLGGGLLVALGVGRLVWWPRVRSSDPSPGPSSRADPATESAAPVSDRSGTEIARSVLEDAHDALSSGDPDRAVALGYTALRHALSDRIDARTASTTLTHWEFYRRWTDQRSGDSDGNDEARTALRLVTERYERATFGVAEISPDEAERVLEAVRTLSNRYADSDDDDRSGGTDG